METVSISEIKQATGLSRPTLYRHLRNGELGHFLIGRRRIVPREDFERFLSARRIPAKPSKPTGASV